MTKRHQDCSNLSSSGPRWLLYVAKLTTASMKTAPAVVRKAHYPARVSRNMPMQMSWGMKLTVPCWIQLYPAVVPTLASVLARVATCTLMNRIGKPCHTCMLKGTYWPMASIQNHWNCRGHTMEQDLKLQWPFRMLMAGCSGSGKSTLTTKLVAQAEDTMTRVPPKNSAFL